MKARLVMLLCACSAVHAEALPPVIDNSMYPENEVSAVRPAAPNALYEMMGRVDQLQAEVRQLTGRVEEQGQLIDELKKSQSTLYSDFDGRMQSLEKKSAPVGAAVATEVQGQDGSVEAETKVNVPNVAVPAPAPAESQEAKPAPVQKRDTMPASADEKQQYQQAYEALRNGHTAQAIADFNVLLSKNPNSDYANNAQYWLGEAYRVNQDVDAARSAFNGVIQNYPDSSKVPDALLKLGYIEVEQKNSVKAREYLTRVTVDFPSSTAARLAAKKLLLLDDIK